MFKLKFVRYASVLSMNDEKKVLEALKKAGKPLRPKEIAKLTGLDDDLVSKIIKKLKKEGKIKSPKRCFYSPT